MRIAFDLLKKKVRDLIASIKDTNRRINEDYHSRKNSKGWIPYLTITALFLVLSVGFLRLAGEYKTNYFVRIIFDYTFLFLIGASLIIISSCAYLYGSNDSNEKLKKILYKIIIAITAIIGIPVVIVIVISDKTIGARARNRDSIESWFLTLMFDAIFVVGLSCPLGIAAKKITEWLAEKVNAHVNLKIMEVSRFTVWLFLVMVFLKVLIDLINMIAKWIIILSRKKRIAKEIAQIKEKYKLSDEIEINKRVVEHQEKEEKNLKDDLNYHQKTHWIAQLLLLIVVFIIAAFFKYYDIPGLKNGLIFEEVKGIDKYEVINVVTAFTMIMLFRDKRKEWK